MNRIRIAWAVIRGRAVIANAHFIGGFTLAPGSRDTLVVGNTFEGTSSGAPASWFHESSKHIGGARP